VLVKNAKIMFTNTMSIFCSIPLISLLFACSEIPKVSYETIKLQRPTTIDCKGEAYNKGKVTELQILADNVTIKRCKINGSIRTIGLGHNGEAPDVKASSVKAGHTERAQAAAPKNAVLYAVTITGYGRIPLYLGPGTTRLTMYDSRIKGRSNSVALYLDAESGFNIIRNNTFDITSASREIIAVDGSANNQLLANAIKTSLPMVASTSIATAAKAAPCVTSHHKTISLSGNTINNTGGYGIWLGSRNGGRLYCKDDAGLPFW
jgi:hypothetical protein